MHTLIAAQKSYQADFILGLQDVVEIMKESLFDKLVDENGHVDVARSGGMSQQKEGKRFLSVLQRKANAEEKSLFSIAVSANPIALICSLVLVRCRNSNFMISSFKYCCLAGAL